MIAKWGKCIVLALCLATLAVGCRTARPDVKPPTAKERLVVPPPGTLDTPEYPKAAFDSPEDPARRQMDMRALGNAGSRGGMMPTSGMGGMGGMGGRPGY